MITIARLVLCAGLTVVAASAAAAGDRRGNSVNNVNINGSSNYNSQYFAPSVYQSNFQNQNLRLKVQTPQQKGWGYQGYGGGNYGYGCGSFYGCKG